MIALGVNIDHVATLRQARYRGMEGKGLPEPAPVEAARIAVAAGADCITLHLREDRRHIVDADVFAIRMAVRVKLNLEMAVAESVVRQALSARPDQTTLVPERRQEITTEGGLDLAKGRPRLETVIARLRERRISVSLFLDPDLPAMAEAVRLGADAVELHTGTYALSRTRKTRARELSRLREAARCAYAEGLSVYAGHGLNYTNVRGILTIPEITEANIGHSIVARAVYVGLFQAVSEMKRALSGRAS